MTKVDPKKLELYENKLKQLGDLVDEMKLAFNLLTEQEKILAGSVLVRGNSHWSGLGASLILGNEVEIIQMADAIARSVATARQMQKNKPIFKPTERPN